MRSIRDYTCKATGEILKFTFNTMPGKVFTCPKCKTGKIIILARLRYFPRKPCRWRRYAPRPLKLEMTCFTCIIM